MDLSNKQAASRKRSHSSAEDQKSASDNDETKEKISKDNTQKNLEDVNIYGDIVLKKDIKLFKIFLEQCTKEEYEDCLKNYLLFFDTALLCAAAQHRFFGLMKYDIYSAYMVL